MKNLLNKIYIMYKEVVFQLYLFLLRPVSSSRTQKMRIKQYVLNTIISFLIKVGLCRVKEIEVFDSYLEENNSFLCVTFKIPLTSYSLVQISTFWHPFYTCVVKNSKLEQCISYLYTVNAKFKVTEIGKL